MNKPIKYEQKLSNVNIIVSSSFSGDVIHLRTIQISTYVIDEETILLGELKNYTPNS